MSWTTVAARVFQDRYDKTAWKWSSQPEDTYRSGAILEARLGMILYPSQRATLAGTGQQAGWFVVNPNVGVQLKGGGRDPRALPCLVFRTIPEAFGARQLDITDNDDYVDTGAWYRQDWDLADLQAAGMSAEYRAFLEQAKALWYRILSELAWVPNTVAVRVDRAIAAGLLPQMVDTSVWQAQKGPLPDWLSDPYRQAAWNELRDDLGDLNAQVSAVNLRDLNHKAQVLRSSREFWDKVATYSGADKLESMWKKIVQGTKAFNTNIEVGRDAVRRMKALVKNHPGAFTQSQEAKVAEIELKIEREVQGARSAMGPSILQALGKDGHGLGIAPIIVIGLGVAALAAAATIITTWVVQAEKTARLAMDHEQELLMTAEKAAAQAHAERQASIIQRQNELYELRDAQRISPQEFAQQMQQLEDEARANDLSLTQRRDQTRDISQAHAKNLNDLRKSEVTGGLAQMGNITMWAALGVGALFIGPAIARRVSK